MGPHGPAPQPRPLYFPASLQRPQAGPFSPRAPSALRSAFLNICSLLAWRNLVLLPKLFPSSSEPTTHSQDDPGSLLEKALVLNSSQVLCRRAGDRPAHSEVQERPFRHQVLRASCLSMAYSGPAHTCPRTAIAGCLWQVTPALCTPLYTTFYSLGRHLFKERFLCAKSWAHCLAGTDT